MNGVLLHAEAEAIDLRAVTPRSGSRIRIAYCVARMDLGGTELNAVRTAERLDHDRFDVTVASLVDNGPLLERYANASIPVERFPITSLYNATALGEGLRLYRFLLAKRIEILHCHDMYSNVFAAPWARLARVPLVIASRRWIHPVSDRRLELANRVAYRLVHRVLGNSRAVAQLLRDGDGVAERRILWVPNFVEERAFESPISSARSSLRNELGIPANAEIVGCIARLVEVKDHATLLRAIGLIAARRPALHVVLIGDGPCRPALEGLARELGISAQTHFAGMRPNLPNLHHFFDVSVLASLTEGFPNSLVEAMAAGRPVVATNVGGNPDAVRPSTGMLVPPKDPSAFARALERMLADEDLRRRMGAAAVKIARSEYHVDAVIPALETMYVRLLGRRMVS
jgi:glycosyltransferase involved in cell wall biosynthesis